MGPLTPTVLQLTYYPTSTSFLLPNNTMITTTKNLILVGLLATSAAASSDRTSVKVTRLPVRPNEVKMTFSFKFQCEACGAWGVLSHNLHRGSSHHQDGGCRSTRIKKKLCIALNSLYNIHAVQKS